MSESKVPLPQHIWFGSRKLYTIEQLRSYGDARAAEAHAAKDAAYEERNRVVALLAALLPSVRTRTAIEGWSDDWHGCVYITLPDGSQASWHFHDSQAHLFAHVTDGKATWDGHTTPEKYARIERCIATRPNIAAEARRVAQLEITKLEDMVRDLVMGHADDCKCRFCRAVFREGST